MSDLALQQLYGGSLVLARVAGLSWTAPLYGGADTPARVRILAALSLAFFVVPTQLGQYLPLPVTAAASVLALVGELLLGLTLGFAVMLSLHAMQLAGQIIGQMSGLSLADVFNPGDETALPVFSRFLYLLALAVYVTIGGHRLLIAGLLATFARLPPGQAFDSAPLIQTVLTLLAESFALGIRVAAPAMLAILLATLVVGLISRTLPQLNVLSLGFATSAVVTLGALSASLTVIAWVFNEQIGLTLQSIADLTLIDG